MKRKLLFFLLYVLLGLALESVCEMIHSDYLTNLYKTPFFAVLVTITVFAFTLFSYLSGKISEIEKEYEFSFSNTRAELGGSFLLLIICDVIFVVLLILRFSDLSESWIGMFALMSALDTFLCCVLHILIDLGMSIYKMFETLGDINSGKIKLKPTYSAITTLKYLLYNQARPITWVDEWLKEKGYNEKEVLDKVKSQIYKTQGFFVDENDNIVFLGDNFVTLEKKYTQ